MRLKILRNGDEIVFLSFPSDSWILSEYFSNASPPKKGTLFSFYKHLVYKHAKPQILGKFKHIAKHAPGWDFWFQKILGGIFKNKPIFRHFWLEFHKKTKETLIEYQYQYQY